MRDVIRFFVKDKKDALILDFFAGSGTTLHAVNLINAEDEGLRRCIMVTNNELSDKTAEDMKKKGYQPGDSEWDALGIARHVTWPRTVCSITGKVINGNSLKGDYGLKVDRYIEDDDDVFDAEGNLLDKRRFKKAKVETMPELSNIKLSDGFKANCEYFKLTFLDKTSVALGRQFRELLPVLWMKGGAIGKCPVMESDELPNMLILPHNKMAVLIDEIYYSKFDTELKKHPEIQTIFIITDSEAAYRTMIRTYDGKACYQLYRDYLDNFRINTGR